MASFFFFCTKLIQCVENIFHSSKFANKFLYENGSFQYNVYGPVKKKHVLIIPSFCGILSEEEKKEMSDRTEEVVHNVALATIALKDGNLDKTEKMLLKTIDLAETNNLSLGVVSACDLLSSVAMKTGDYDRAEDLLIRALDNLLRQGAPADDNFVISFNLKLSRIYSISGNDDLAELGFKNCLNLQRSKLENNLDDDTFLLWATILYWYGKFLLSRNRYKEAKICLQDCYKTSLRVEELLPSQVMVILYNLGEVCQILGDQDEALEHFLKGVSLDKKSKNPDQTYFYNKLGNIFMCKGLYKEAKLWCDQGQKFATRYRNLEAERESKECLEKLSGFFIT